MKKFIALSTILAFSTPTMAGFQNNTSSNGGFNGSRTTSAQVTTVAQAKKSYDNTHFSIVGNITNCYDDDDCTFRDSTGTIHIDVEDGAWGGQNVNPNTRVRISGKVDHDDGRTKLDVYRITVL